MDSFMSFVTDKLSWGGGTRAGTRIASDGTAFKAVEWASNAARAAAVVLVVSSLWGDPIACYVQGDFYDISNAVLDAYCWITGVHTVALRSHGEVSPGVSQVPHMRDPHHFHPQTYYVWVPLVLFLLSVLLRMPAGIWAAMEGGTVKEAMVRGCYIEDQADTETRLKLANHIIRYRGHRTQYGLCYLLSHLLLLLAVISTAYLLDVFLNGNFLDYGLTFFGLKHFPVYDLQPNGRLVPTYVAMDSMSAVFPTMAKCNYEQISESGMANKLAVMCMMPVNNANQKLFIAIWIVLFLLAVFLVLNLFWQLCLAASPALRYYATSRNVAFDLDGSVITTALKGESYGGWVIMHRIGCNIGNDPYGDLLSTVGKLATEGPSSRSKSNNNEESATLQMVRGGSDSHVRKRGMEVTV